MKKEPQPQNQSELHDAKKKEALKFIDQGNFNAAIGLLTAIHNPNEEIQDMLQKSRQKLVRKYWRQRKLQELEKNIENRHVFPQQQLALARLKGPDHLKKYAEEKNGYWSDLAAISLLPDTKSALLAMRQIPEFKTLAEGWLAIIKGDYKRAIELFQLAAIQQPIMARIGEGIACMAMKNDEHANAHLKSLRIYASHFPELTKVMRWEDPSQEARRVIFSEFHLLKIEDLQKIEKSLPAQAKEMRGWLYLKMGDLTYHSRPDQSLHFWSKGADLNKQLRVDHLKRRYLDSYRPDSSVKLEPAFADLYEALSNIAPMEARQFIEHAMFESSKTIFSEFSAEALQKGIGKWNKHIDKIEINLLWFLVAYFQTFKTSEQLLWKHNFDLTSLGKSWEEWQALFAKLDPHYSLNEKYLKAKITLCHLLKKDREASNAIATLLQCHPTLQEEFIPLYTQHMLNLNIESMTKQDRQDVSQEIDRLLQLFPIQFDLLRLSLLFAVENVNGNQLFSYSTKISTPLYNVLTLQYYIDKKETYTVCKKFIPNFAQCGLCKEADWRLLSALLHTRVKYKVKDLGLFIKKIAPDGDTKHEYFSQNMKRGGQPIPKTIIKSWREPNPFSWRPYYHQTYFHKFQNDIPAFKRDLEIASSKISPDMAEYKSIMKTCEHFSIRRKMVSSFQDFDLEQFFNTLLAWEEE